MASVQAAPPAGGAHGGAAIPAGMTQQQAQEIFLVSLGAAHACARFASRGC